MKTTSLRRLSLELPSQGSRVLMAPLIDLLFVVLIFVMVTAEFVGQGIEVELPAARGTPLPTPSTTLTIDSQGDLALGENRLSFREEEKLARLLSPLAEGGSALVIRADRRAPVEAVVAVLSVARALGFGQISLQVVPPQRGGTGPVEP